MGKGGKKLRRRKVVGVEHALLVDALLDPVVRHNAPVTRPEAETFSSMMK